MSTGDPRVHSRNMVQVWAYLSYAIISRREYIAAAICNFFWWSVYGCHSRIDVFRTAKRLGLSL